MIALIGALLVAGAVPVLSSAASALPKQCPDGTPAPCEVVDPPTTRPTPTTVRPAPTTAPPTTKGPVATTPTLPPATLPPVVTVPPVVTIPPTLPPVSLPPVISPTYAWEARVNVLDQSSTGFDRNVTGRLSQDNLIWETSTAPGTVTWTNPERTEGVLGLNSSTFPAGGPIGLRLDEMTSLGRLCRSKPGAPPASGQTAHVLVAPTITRTPDQLSAMVSGFSGRVTPDPDGAEVTINSTSLSPQQDGLLLTVGGRIWKDLQWPIPNVDASFTYTVMLHVKPSTGIGSSSVMFVTADPGDLELDGDGWTDDVEIWLGDDVEPDFREAVQTKATTAVNANVAAEPDAVWFRSLGYTVSVRSVITTPAGITVLPSLCKLS